MYFICIFVYLRSAACSCRVLSVAFKALVLFFLHWLLLTDHHTLLPRIVLFMFLWKHEPHKITLFFFFFAIFPYNKCVSSSESPEIHYKLLIFNKFSNTEPLLPWQISGKIIILYNTSKSPLINGIFPNHFLDSAKFPLKRHKIWRGKQSRPGGTDSIS